MTQINEAEKFSCIVIGSGSLTIRCAEILMSRGHVIRALVSDDRITKKWAVENDLVCLSPRDNIEAGVEKPFDYLFSIVNEHILRDDVLTLPRKLAINYHDALLPRYAGTHATSWAIINGEKTHGITWHVISEVVDAGDVLVQREVEITPDDSALTLNTKCFEAAISGFGELVDLLSSGTYVRRPQDLTRRTFYPRFKRPENACVIDWERPAEEISALFRGLDLGSHPNPLGRPKIIVEDRCYIVADLHITDEISGGEPGTITEMRPDGFRLATASSDIFITSLQTLGGQDVPLSEFAARSRPAENVRLTNPEQLSRIDELFKETARHEAGWVRRLSSLEPAVPPFMRSAAKQCALSQFNTLDLTKTTGEYSANELLAVFASLLARLGAAGEFDIGFEGPAMRSRYDAFANIFAVQVPLKVSVNAETTFDELAASLAEATAVIADSPSFALDIVTRYPQIPTSARTGSPVAAVLADNLDEPQPIDGNQLIFSVSTDGRNARFIYDSGCLDISGIERLAEHFAVLLDEMHANRHRAVSRLPILTDLERQKLLIDWNKPVDEQRQYECIHRLFERQAAATPENIALIAGNVRLTYRELNSRANRLAAHLVSMGAGPESLIGICLERSQELIIGVLAILKSGAAYIPMDPAYPADRLSYTLEDSRASIVVTTTSLAKNIDSPDRKLVCIDREADAISHYAETDLETAVQPENLAYVIYTSGSTGKPKGVAIEHRSTAAFLDWALSVYSREQLRGVLASTSVCFDLSIFEMFAPLSCGGTVILVENILHLPDAPAAPEVTLINTVPSAITELLRMKGVPRSVATVNLAGEPLKSSLVKQIYDVGSINQVFDLYGPSEDTTYSTFTLRDAGAANIGRPITNTQAYVVDKQHELVPIGVPGELLLGGAGLARGYLNRPELTAEKFIANPFTDDRASRLYRTGDLVRYLPDGRLEYLGRIDNQVKIRGFRIELGEIEATVTAHPGIRDSVVIAREDQPGDKRLAAYIVLNNSTAVSVAEIREYLKVKLPDHMVPSAFVELAELPLTPNGKVDRKALPAPDTRPAETAADFEGFRNDVEERLAAIWEGILQVRPIGVHDNFFELGGHSLQAVRMFAEVEEAFGKNIPLATLFEAGTIEKLAEILGQDGWSAPESSLVPIQPNGTRPNFFCIHAKGGNVLFYRDLAKHLGSDQPFFGLQARRLGGRQVGHGTVEEMAEFYIKEIRACQPEGPYFIGGSSFGGLAAWEIARQLTAHGQRVALLALMDTGTPDYPQLLPGTGRFRAKVYDNIRRVQHHIDSLKAFDSGEKAAYVIDKLKKFKLQYKRRLTNGYKKAVRKFYLRTKGQGSIPKNYIQIEDQIWRAGQKYKPSTYSGKLTLFRASNQPLGIVPDPTLGWDELAGNGIEIIEVPGHHGSIVAEPYVRVLADRLAACIDRAAAERKATDDEREAVRLDPVYATVS